MENNIFKNVYIVRLMTFLLLLSIISCQKDQPIKTASGNFGITSRSDCKLFMKYEVETTRIIKPVKNSDVQALSRVDQALSLPQRERYAVEACYKADGQKTVIMTKLKPEKPIIYPDNALVGFSISNHSKVVYENDKATYYDQFGEIMSVTPLTMNSAATQQILDMVPTAESLSDAQFNLVIEVLKNDASAQVEEHDNNLISIRTNMEDGGYSIQVIDKITRATVGNLHYDKAGSLLSRSMYDVGGNARQPILQRYLLESYFTSIEGGIPMKAEQHGKVSNFEISFN